MSGNKEGNRPASYLTPGYSPRSPNQQASGEYNRYNQPVTNLGGTAYDINDQGRIIDPQTLQREEEAALQREEEAALQREERRALRRERQNAEAAANNAESAAAYTGRKARQVAEDVDYFLDESDKLYASINAMDKKMKSAVAVAERARNASTTQVAETAVSLEESKQATEEAIKLVNQTNAMVEEFKQATINYVAGVGDAQRGELNAKLQEIDEKMKELDEKTKQLAEKESVDPGLVEDLKKENETVEKIVDNSKEATANANTEEPLERSKMGICFIKFEGTTNILNPYADSQETRNKINPILPVNFNVGLEGIGDFADVPAGNYLFVDNFQLKLSDFKKMNRSEFIDLILNPQEFILFLEKLERSSVERKFVDFRKKEKLSKEDRKINKENAKIYARKLFGSGEDFNIVYPKQPDGSGGYYFDYVIMSYEIEKKDIKGPDAFRFDVEKQEIKKEEVEIAQKGGALSPSNTNSPEKYTFFTFKIKLVLDSRERSEITPEDLKIVGCEQRKARIYKIMGKLDGTRSIITTILGPEGAKKYLADDTDMEKLHGRAKPLPSKLKGYQREKSMLDKLSFVSQVNPRDIPSSRSNQEDVLRRQRMGQNSLITSSPTIGGKKTKRIIIYHKKDKYNKKTKKGIYKQNHKKYKNTKKLIKKKKIKKTRKV